jgi:acyl-CoA synthetase (AMP-forming)/AMP-acid ligase II
MKGNHELRPDTGHRTLMDVLAMNLRDRAGRQAIAILDRDGQEVEQATYAELDRRVRSVAAVLQQAISPGQRVMIMFPTGIDFVVGFFACAYAGVTGVPVPPPEAGLRHVSRLRGIVKDADPAAVLTTREVAESEVADELGTGQIIVVGDVDPGLADLWRDPDVDTSDPAFLQYTSGSTSEPKGAIISNANVIANLSAAWRLADAERSGPDGVRIVSWLPLFHDMGLLQPMLAFYTGGQLALIPPMAFMMRPVVWFEAMTHYRGEFCCAPNFAYDLCRAKLTPEQRARLDLSSWRVAVNGAEPVRDETLVRFAETFAECGFSASALWPSYGMAEGMVYMSGARYPDDVRCVELDAVALEQEHRLAQPRQGGEIRRIVGCGHPPANLNVRIVDPETLELAAPDRPGEIWLSGASISSGYWQRPDVTEAKFGGTLAAFPGESFLRSGDLGFVRDGQVFVLGRIDDMIVVDGRNHYPQDIELTVDECHEAVEPGRAAAFAYQEDGRTRLAIIAESRRRVQIGSSDRVREVTEAIRGAVSTEHQIAVSAVVLLKPGGLPRTTSGKVQRSRARVQFLANELKSWPAS